MRGIFVCARKDKMDKTFDHLWNLQELFYEDRPLTFLSNQDILTLLKRLEDETHECRQEIIDCMKTSGMGECVNFLTDSIRQEVSDLFLFVLAIARCIGLTSPQVIADATEKVARNICRYPASNFQDVTDIYSDKTEASRTWDKKRRFTQSFYQIPAS